jgi:hypothetical protein
MLSLQNDGLLYKEKICKLVNVINGFLELLHHKSKTKPKHECKKKLEIYIMWLCSNRRSGGHLSLSFCIQFSRHHVNIAF